MDTYHVIVKSTKTNELVTEFNISCKLGYLVEYTRKKLIELGYSYYNISKNFYMVVYVSDDKITSMI